MPKQLLQELAAKAATIPATRKTLLESTAVTIADMLAKEARVNLLFVCTHNSRRSMMAQIWAAAAAAHEGLKQLHTYSGGTEATAFNIRAVAAMERAGFVIETEGANQNNPHYLVMIPNGEPAICFSKKFDDAINTPDHLVAIMVCSDADEACPVVAGAAHRIAITYVDPKAFDDTDKEVHSYDDAVHLIGTEMIYMIGQVASILRQ